MGRERQHGVKGNLLCSFPSSYGTTVKAHRRANFHTASHSCSQVTLPQRHRHDPVGFLSVRPARLGFLSTSIFCTFSQELSKCPAQTISTPLHGSLFSQEDCSLSACSISHSALRSESPIPGPSKSLERWCDPNCSEAFSELWLLRSGTGIEILNGGRSDISISMSSSGSVPNEGTVRGFIGSQQLRQVEEIASVWISIRRRLAARARILNMRREPWIGR